ncbi:SMI1/KNR4 family protein [Chryseobacterium joostei]|uniref:SMI1 / KNR4 family (SUKH-1) n=1 Tax=Chryseobacterium joostei TaxID=112234 RepID=A0A1N7IRU2_9FLAO|nr:SMI1/KNR4 family protein [Chryseobacterium joostei]AZA98279.1 SMI1/KNR4 family protein [Chryseobacterium joostei]SIS39813.1 SMI1 / KNR4 family (SUKH-1) [Chryseobacterium joostei]
MNITEKLKQKSLQLKERNLFAKGASESEIENFETTLNIKLPLVLKAFYLLNNGGCFADNLFKTEELQNPEDLGSIIWNSNYFLSLKEIIEAYNFDGSFTLIDYQEQEKYTGKRLIPIMHTRGQENLVWDATEVHSTKILDAFHEFNADEWKVLYPSFEDLLETYLEKDGDIETIA